LQATLPRCLSDLLSYTERFLVTVAVWRGRSEKAARSDCPFSIIVLLLLTFLAALKAKMHASTLLSSSLFISAFAVAQLLLLRAEPISGLPTGAASCIPNTAAVGGFHLDESNNRNVIQGELAVGGVRILINDDDDMQLLPTAPITLQTGTDYTITVLTDMAQGFQGILLRLGSRSGSSRDLTTSLYPRSDDPDLQVAQVCVPPVAGVTHTNPDPKVSVTAVLRFDVPDEDLRLDVTLVGLNDETTSVFGYNQFQVVVEGEVTTPAPTAEPLPPGITAAPTVSPAPTVQPTVTDVTGTLSPTYDMDNLMAAGASSSSSSSALVARSCHAIGGMMVIMLVLLAASVDLAC